MRVLRRGRARLMAAVAAAVGSSTLGLLAVIVTAAPEAHAAATPAPPPGLSISVARGGPGTTVDVSVHDCSNPTVTFTDRGITDTVKGVASNQPTSSATAQGDFTGTYKIPNKAQAGTAEFTAGCASAVQGGYYGATFQVTAAAGTISPNVAPGASPNNYVAMASVPDGSGYWIAAADGGVYSFNVPFYGSEGSAQLNAAIVDIAATADGKGYWLVGSDGGIFTFGDAVYYGSTGSTQLNAPIVGMTPTPDGKGYWLVGSDGGVFSFGDAVFAGTCVPNCGSPIVGISADQAATGNNGYWLTAQNGGVFSYGAMFYGSMGGNINNGTAIAGTKDGGGYWLAGTDGGVFNFGDAGFYGSAANYGLFQPADGINADLASGGYWLIAHDGGVFSFNAPFHGSVPGGIPPNPPTAVNATAGNASATITWTPPAYTGSGITSYTVTSNPGNIQATAPATATQATVSGLTNGTSYTFTVTSNSNAGPSAPSSPSNAVTPMAGPTPGVGLYSAGQLTTQAQWSSVIAQGWAGLYDTEALGTTSAPYTAVTSGNPDAGVGAALDTAPSYTGAWVSYWTVTSPPSSQPDSSFYNYGHAAGAYAATHTQQLTSTHKPNFLAIDYEGNAYPQTQSEYVQMTNGWADGIHSVLPNMQVIFYTSGQSIYTSDNLSVITSAQYQGTVSPIQGNTPSVPPSGNVIGYQGLYANCSGGNDSADVNQVASWGPANKEFSQVEFSDGVNDCPPK